MSVLAYLALGFGLPLSVLGIAMYELRKTEQSRPNLPKEVEKELFAYSIMLLVGVSLVTPWLFRLPFRMETGAEVVAPIIFGLWPIVIAACLLQLGWSIVHLCEKPTESLLPK